MEIKVIAAFLGAVLGWFFGGLDTLLYILVVFVAVDYLTGVFAAFFQRKVSSRIGVKGIMKKVLIFLLVGIGNGVDMALGIDGAPVRTAVIFFYLSNEGISILENAARMGLPVPAVLKKVLGELQEDGNEKS